MSETGSDPVRMFISHSHDSAEHRDRVLALANRMRGEGVACRIDRFIESPREGWPLCMQAIWTRTGKRALDAYPRRSANAAS